MFEKDIFLVGKHATYTKILGNKEDGIFDRYIDVYINGAILGFLYGRTSKRDLESKDRASILAGVFATEKLNCDFIYRLIMLLDETEGLSIEQRVDRAFRDDAMGDDSETHQKNMELFNSYVLGGIEVLYEMFIEGCTTKEDYINKIYEGVTRFKDEIEDVSLNDQINHIINK